jgi:hypothetical protein
MKYLVDKRGEGEYGKRGWGHNGDFVGFLDFLVVMKFGDF